MTSQESPSREAAPLIKEPGVVIKEEVTPSTAVVEPPLPAARETKTPTTAVEEKEDKQVNKETAVEKEAELPFREPVVPDKPPVDVDEAKADTALVKELPLILEKEAQQSTQQKPEEKPGVPKNEVKVEEMKEDGETVVGEEPAKEETIKRPDEANERDVKVDGAANVRNNDEDKQLPKLDEVEREKLEDVDSGGETYEIMNMGEREDNSSKETENIKQDDEYEVMSFNPTQEDGAKKKEENKSNSTVTDVPKKEIAPGKVNQYDEVAGDFLPLSPLPKKVNQYDDVAGDFPTKATPKSHPYDDVAGDFLPTKFKSKSPDAAGPGVCLSPSYEHMEPAEPARIDDQFTTEVVTDGDYVPMKDYVITGRSTEPSREGSETTQYEHMEEWTEKKAQRTNGVSNGTVPVDRSYEDYDVPRPLGVSSPNHDPALPGVEDNAHLGIVSSSGSVSSQKSDGQLKNRHGSGSEERRRGSSSASKKSSEGSLLMASNNSELERDSLGVSEI